MEKILEGCIDNISLRFGGSFKENHSLSINTNSVPLLVHIFSIHIKQSSSRLCSPGRKQPKS